MQESSPVSDLVKGEFVLVQMTGKRSIFHYVAEVMNDFDGYGYEIRYYKLKKITNKFILYKENEYFVIPSSDILRKPSPPLPVGTSKCHASQLFSTGFQCIQCETDLSYLFNFIKCMCSQLVLIYFEYNLSLNSSCSSYAGTFLTES